MSPGSGCRTFCCCREGEATATLTPTGIFSISGRADVNATSRSNIGFNLRVTDESLGSSIWNEYRSIEQTSEYCETNWFNGQQLVGDDTMKCVSGWIGHTAARLLLQGLGMLLNAYPELKTTNVRLLGPCVEGVGFYPTVDQSLRVTPYPVWIAGDSTGIFRGLTASFVSGYYAGWCASQRIANEQ